MTKDSKRFGRIGDDALGKGNVCEWTVCENRRGPAERGLLYEGRTMVVCAGKCREQASRLTVTAVLGDVGKRDVATTYKACIGEQSSEADSAGLGKSIGH